MKSLHEMMNREINEKYRKGDNVRPVDKKHKYYQKMGVVMRVGTGKRVGVQTVKFPDGQVMSFDDDELEMPKLAEYNFNAHARTVSKAKNFKKGMDNTTYNITYVKGKSISTEKGLTKSDMVNWVNKLKKSGYKIEGIIDSEGRDAGTQRANKKGVFK